MEKAVEERIKDMKQTAEKVQILKKETVRAAKKEKVSLAWNSAIKSELPYYLL